MSRFPEVKRVIFDLDNTVIYHDQKKEAQEIADLIGIVATEQFNKEVSNFFLNNNKEVGFRRVTRSYYEYLITSMIPTLRQKGKTGKQFLEALVSRNSTLEDGAKESLQYLYDKGYIIVALTNWFAVDQIKLLKELEVLEYFERVYGWDDNYPKPHKDAFSRSLDFTDPEKNLIVGDSVISDIEPAKKSGINTIGYKIDREKYIKNEHIPDLYIDHLLEIKGIL